MDGIDRRRIDAIILRESGDSAYMKQQRKRDADVNVRISTMQKRLDENPPPWPHDPSIDEIVGKSLGSRPTRSVCVVVDMDMFYMACELLSRPDLQYKPACVGNGMILTANYVARKYGVRSAMAGFIGDKLVEELSDGKERLVHVPSNFTLYKAKAGSVRKVLAEYDPSLRAYSLDEAYLDIGPYVAMRLKGLCHKQIVDEFENKRTSVAKDDRQDGIDEQVSVDMGEDNVDDGIEAQPDQVQKIERNHPDNNGKDDINNRGKVQTELNEAKQELVLSVAAEVVSEMRAKVKAATGLTCSAGLAPNFMLAKIASDRNKPNGQAIVGPAQEDVAAFLHPLPVRKVPGVGRVTDKILNAFGIKTVQDLYQEQRLVRFLFKPATSSFLVRASIGCSGSHDFAEESESRKGISVERTFRSGEPYSQVCARLYDISHRLSDRMKEKNLWAQTVTIKVKLHTFDVLSRAKSLPRGTFLQDGPGLATIATELLGQVRDKSEVTPFSVRLLGVRCSNFQTDSERLACQKMSITRFLSSSPAKKQTVTKVISEENMDSKSSDVGVNSVGIGSNPTSSQNNKDDKQHNCKERNNDNSATLPAMMDTPSCPDPIPRCPICQKRLSRNNLLVNQHMDACLKSSNKRSMFFGPTSIISPTAVARRSASPVWMGTATTNHPIVVRPPTTAMRVRKKRRLTDFFR